MGRLIVKRTLRLEGPTTNEIRLNFTGRNQSNNNINLGARCKAPDSDGRNMEPKARTVGGNLIECHAPGDDYEANDEALDCELSQVVGSSFARLSTRVMHITQSPAVLSHSNYHMERGWDLTLPLGIQFVRVCLFSSSPPAPPSPFNVRESYSSVSFPAPRALGREGRP